MATLSTQYFNSILSILETMQFDARGAVAQMGVDNATLENPKHRIEINLLEEIFNLASSALSEPNIGLEVGYRFRVATFTETGSILAHCKTLAEASRMNVKYQHLVESLGQSEYVRRDDGAFLMWRGGFEDVERYRQITELIIVGYTLTTNWLSWGFDGGAKNLSFRHTAPESRDRYYEILQCPVIWGTDENYLSFDIDFVDRELPTSNPEKLMRVQERLDALLMSYENQSTLQANSIEFIHLAIRNSRLSIGGVAADMGMSERTLRRALRAEGLTYRGLVERVRQNICKTYMADGRSLTDIAQILGYNDQSAFTRAFKKWYGVVPSEYKIDKLSM